MATGGIELCVVSNTIKINSHVWYNLFDKFSEAIDVHIRHDKVKRVYGKVYMDVKLNVDHNNAIYFN